MIKFTLNTNELVPLTLIRKDEDTFILIDSKGDPKIFLTFDGKNLQYESKEKNC